MEERQRQADAQAGRSKDDDGNTRGPTGRVCQRELGVPEDEAQENFTDPQSRIMQTGEGFQQCYNGQAAVDEGSQLIVPADLSNQAPDNGQLLPMLALAKANTGQAPTVALADAGYASEATFQALEDDRPFACIALGREDKRHRAIDPEHYPATARMLERLATPEGKAHYRRRKSIPEPVFGWIKQAIGFRRFSLRGLHAANAEWHLVCMAVNLKRMHAPGWRPA